MDQNQPPSAKAEPKSGEEAFGADPLIDGLLDMPPWRTPQSRFSNLTGGDVAAHQSEAAASDDWHIDENGKAVSPQEELIQQQQVHAAQVRGGTSRRSSRGQSMLTRAKGMFSSGKEGRRRSATDIGAGAGAGASAGAGAGAGAGAPRRRSILGFGKRRSSDAAASAPTSATTTIPGMTYASTGGSKSEGKGKSKSSSSSSSINGTISFQPSGNPITLTFEQGEPLGIGLVSFTTPSTPNVRVASK